MRKKPLNIICIALCVTVVVIIAAFFIVSFDKNELETSVNSNSTQQITLNQTISEAVTIYATSPYRKYSSEELRKYFIREITEEILRGYEPFIGPNDETLMEFEEQPLPEIGTIWITFDDGQYYVKLQFGEVFYNYRLSITPNRIITQITDGGITFE